MLDVPDSASFSLLPCSYDDVRRLQQELKCPETLAWVLVRRGILTAGAAREWLVEPTVEQEYEQFHDPMLMGDMAAAVERIHFAIRNHEPIVVHGDYDADGVCSTTLLTEALEALGAEVRPFLPSRFTNGYGLQLDSVERFAHDGMRLIITVDCGITAVEPIAQAVDRGIDVIVCDHHEPGEQLPAAIICSTRPSNYPFQDLCATAVAGKLVQALGAPYGDAQHELEAIATVADVVPLVGENRHIVRRGLRAIRRSNRPGLRALLSTCNLHAADVTADDIAFKLAPRINAVGRLGESERAYELFRADTPERAAQGAAVLHETNDERRRIEGKIVEQAVAQIDGFTELERSARAYVVSGNEWHEGVVGIVAARLVEKYNRPVIVLSEQDPLARGSGRSIRSFDLHSALGACSHLLTRWGGHKAAAGLTIEPQLIPALRAAIAAYANEHLSESDLRPITEVDAVIAGDEISMALAEEMEKLAPFGQANPRPTLLAVGVTASDVRVIGDDKTHLQCTLTTGGVSARAIGFGHAQHAARITSGAPFDASVQVSINRFRGRETLQLQIDTMLPWNSNTTSTRSCIDGCIDTIDISALVRAQTAPHPFAEVEDSKLPALEPLLARTSTVDLRNHNRAPSHIARLATSGANQIVVCADVSLRRRLLDGVLHPERFGVSAVHVVSEYCSDNALAQVTKSLSTRGSKPEFVLTDYGALARILDSGVVVDAIVVLDPPVVNAHRDILVAHAVPLHLVFGAAEERFAIAVAGAVANLRGTFGNAWGRLKMGDQSFAVIENELAHGSTPVPTQSAIAHAIYELSNRGLLQINSGDKILSMDATNNGQNTSNSEKVLVVAKT